MSIVDIVLTAILLILYTIDLCCLTYQVCKLENELSIVSAKLERLNHGDNV